MPIFLDENFIGCDDDTIGFPHLLLCLGFVAVVKTGSADSGTLWGVHLTDTGITPRTFGQFAARMLETVNPLHIRAIYGCCNRRVRYVSGDLDAAWRTEMGELAGMLNFTGPARGFDTSIIAPMDGTYVQYDLVPGASRCRIFYKRNEKMNYGEGGGAGARVVLSDTDVGEVRKQYSSQPKLLEKILAKVQDRVEGDTYAVGSARARKNGWNFGRRTMHEVDYALRLDEIDIM